MNAEPRRPRLPIADKPLFRFERRAPLDRGLPGDLLKLDDHQFRRFERRETNHYVDDAQNDINLGIVNIIVGFAPLKPAEFVVIQIQQIAGSIAT